MLRKTLLALAIASALVACGKSAKEPEKAGASASASASAAKDDQKVTLQMSPEDTLTIESDALASGPVITGSIQPERRADLRAEVGAIVIQVLKENGEQVRKGDVLLRLDETSIRDSLTSAEEATRAAEQSLAQAQRMYERQKTLLASGMVSTTALEDAEVRRNNAQSDVAAARSRSVSARQQLTRTLVRAPFDGIVSERKVSNGDTAQVGKELIKVIDPSSMRFEGTVSADKIGVVKVGQPVLFRINGYGDKPFNGKIKRVDPAANAITRQVEVLVEFADSNRPGVAGLYAEGRVEAQSSNSLMIPPSALVQAGDSNYVWRVKGGTLAKVPLTIGTRDERSGRWQVLSGLQAGDMVVRVPASGFKDGQKVQLNTPKAVASATTQKTSGK
ncbi:MULTISPECIES: efflux RND transporter periplasmic adaptor subunit [unclassified Duganella]|jgi:membrane fusion protein (multidrug efflux system)|uniref:efflux RND transporter periplasmic adaptor subunit n=1 Tax=unclassified Duganella TaxID=2636909 RepID=UPI0008867E80|nr:MULTISPECIES: efflux RND transporter periplasmic adaptor subunit [unclassified Duganella]SDH44999.1 RND family efflux transporter, MFP subunit [Duganella sp. OV458]SDK57493.1 RND family efflux transporter, MFP subunit [Duganella sp. OV510]